MTYKKHYTLEQYGRSWVLQHTGTGNKANFKTLQGLSSHILRFGLQNATEGLDKLPAAYKAAIGYKDEPQADPNVVEVILQQSGYTNVALIS